jgi:hypothetical protein
MSLTLISLQRPSGEHASEATTDFVFPDEVPEKLRWHSYKLQPEKKKFAHLVNVMSSMYTLEGYAAHSVALVS